MKHECTSEQIYGNLVTRKYRHDYIIIIGRYCRILYTGEVAPAALGKLRGPLRSDTVLPVCMCVGTGWFRSFL